MFDSRIVKFIRSDLTMRGETEKEQKEGKVARRIIQFFADDGALIFEYDPWLKESKVFREDLI